VSSPAEGRREEVTPVAPAWRKTEPVMLLDLSTSMDWEAAEGSSVSRKDVVLEALPLLVTALEAADSEAATEQAGGSDEEGGLLIHGFASDHHELGDFNSSNMQRRIASIPWGGGTQIMPAWKAALADYTEEFGDETEPPALLTLVVTDGEATDADAFEKVLEVKDPNRYFAIAVIGHGADHDKTVRSYEGAASANPKHVTIVKFDGVTNPRDLAADLITLAGIGTAAK
jgi:hypothetical protein